MEEKVLSGYSDTFRKQVVHHYNTNSVTMRETADLFGITSGTVSKWVTQFQDTPNSSEETETVESLRAEVQELRHDVTVLKRLVRRQLLERNPLYSSDDELSYF